MDVIIIIISFLIIMNIIGFAIMGVDKERAKRREWRIPEKVLFLVCIFGGSLGSTIGMYFFHHKTKHWYFRYGFPVIFTIHIAVAAYLIGSGIIIIM